MESLYLLIPLALIAVTAAGGIFLWAVASGQFDDIDEQAERLPDDE